MTGGGIIDIADKVSNITNELFLSTDKPHIEEVFSKYQISGFDDRINLLRRCMQVQDISNSPGEVSVEDEYAGEVEIFVEGSWRFVI